MIEGELCAADVPYVAAATAAKVALDDVVVRLGKNEHAAAGIRPTLEPELLPGVSDAINEIGKAIEVLRLVRDKGR